MEAHCHQSVTSLIPQDTPLLMMEDTPLPAMMGQDTWAPPDHIHLVGTKVQALATMMNHLSLMGHTLRAPVILMAPTYLMVQ